MKGVLLFAFNSEKYNYYDMAVYTAKRINALLDLPVTLITNEKSNIGAHPFDNIIITDSNETNSRDWGIWINKDRYKAYEFSPYDETILLDTDYLVNSRTLLKLFDLPTEFCFHNRTSFLLQPNAIQEIISPYSFNTAWATVIKFKKTNKAKQIFDCMAMIQNNYDHYANIHGFISIPYRNDYALTLATKIVNGHLDDKANIIPWNLVHVAKEQRVYRINDTSYMLMHEVTHREKTRSEYIIIKDTDFHMLNKDNFMELI